MNILIIHGNFPGQFLHLAPFLSRQGHKVVFLTESDNPQGLHLQDVVLCHFSKSFLNNLEKAPTHQQKALLRAQHVSLAIHQLSAQGFDVDLVIAHGGKGYGLLPRSEIPNVKLLLYVEWFFTSDTSQYLFREYDSAAWSRCEVKNMPLLREMSLADAIVCPSNWQKQQFPLEYRSKITVIFDGIDNHLFPEATPDSRVCSLVLKGTSGEEFTIRSDDLLLTYATRGMEPLRGFPEFMRAAAAAMQKFPHLKVVIAGKDRQAYSYSPTDKIISWKDFMLDELKDQLDLSRLYFPGLLPYVQLSRMLRRSNLHCYFTRPYVISWSFYQAVATKSALMINHFPGLEDVIEQSSLIDYVDIDDQTMINSFVCRYLSSPDAAFTDLPLSLMPGLDLSNCLSQYACLLDSLMNQ